MSVVQWLWDVAADQGPIDGQEIYEALVLAGLVALRPANDKEALALEVEPGDDIYALTDLGKSALGSARQGLRNLLPADFLDDERAADFARIDRLFGGAP